MKKTTAWFGYGTQAKYHAAKPYVAVYRSKEPCKFKGRYTVAAFRFASDEERSGFIARNTGFLLAVLHCPAHRGFEGIAEEAYPHYILD